MTHRIGISRKIWNEIRTKVLKNQALPLRVRLNIYKAVIRSTLTYGLKPGLTRSGLMKLEALQMKAIRAITGEVLRGKNTHKCDK